MTIEVTASTPGSSPDRGWDAVPELSETPSDRPAIAVLKHRSAFVDILPSPDPAESSPVDLIYGKAPSQGVFQALRGEITVRAGVGR
ncbi:MAG: hypothetical protein EOO27_04010 [Comamonadaceae bacterium]|nr:MAG: hypothetical protein EOO27_04010 [Comamonadaceae bacterium]